jgi:hypothetical protein
MKFILLILLCASCYIERDINVFRVKVRLVERREIQRAGYATILLIWEDHNKIQYAEFNPLCMDSIGTTREILLKR